jgi:SCY1-like protein 2
MTEILPIIHLAIESPTHSIVDAALRSLPVILPILDFSTIKNELFPVIAAVFSKTSSLGIKVRGLEAFVILCGGSSDNSGDDGLDGIMGGKKKAAATALDKYTMQEKILPLIKGIKTKEPAVMLAALQVLKQVGNIADTEFIAMDILPVLWTMSLGPLLDLKQFQLFMELIKSLSSRVEQEHTKKLQELSSSTKAASTNEDFMSFGGVAGFAPSNGANNDSEDDFERLVQGKASRNGATSASPMDAGWDATPNTTAASAKPAAATFAWSTTSSLPQASSASILKPHQGPTSRTITPDLSRFESLAPSTTQFSQVLQPTAVGMYNKSTPMQPQTQSQIQTAPQSNVNWSIATSNNAWAANTTPTLSSVGNSMSNLSMNQRPAMHTSSSSFSLPPPPSISSNAFQTPSPQRPNLSAMTGGSFNQQTSLQSAFGGSMNQQQAKPPPSPAKSGLDAYESLL